MIVLGHVSPTQLDRSREHEVTYPDVGRTRSSNLPAGYRHDRLIRRIGHGEIAWERAKEAIRLWKAHARAGVTLTPADTPIQQGATVLASRTFGPVTIVAPCRIVYVTDQPMRFGFGYGTLPGHPEQGEEAFHVALGDDGTVTAEITAFSRPDDLPSRIAAPIARGIQKAVTRRYIDGIEEYVIKTT